MARVAMVAGEASSDQLAAHLIAALKLHLPEAMFYGIGGPKMQREGFDSLWPAEKLAVRGYAEVLRHYPAITRMRRQLLRRLLPGDLDIEGDLGEGLRAMWAAVRDARATDGSAGRQLCCQTWRL